MWLLISKDSKKMAPIQHSDLICVINQMWKLVFNPNEKTPLFLDIVLCSRMSSDCMFSSVLCKRIYTFCKFSPKSILSRQSQQFYKDHLNWLTN